MVKTATNMPEIVGPKTASSARVLTSDALQFIARLHLAFESRRRELLAVRDRRQLALDTGTLPDFLPETEVVRRSKWSVPPPPPDLERRLVEITGPVDRKMMINALNSGADVFMADFEDSLSPTWENVVEGQANLMDAVRRTIEFESPDGREYRLDEDTATLLVRPRGWHLTEPHVEVGGEPVSASLFDFGLYFYHNARELLERGSGPYFYLPKLESHLEARLWNEVFLLAQKILELPRGTIRATVLIENVLAAFEMEEILFELREHAAGLNAGRWDYIFSVIKKFRNRREYLLPDRAQITMTVPFMRAYTEQLVRTCHRRGAHAIGGMAAFIPSRRDSEVNARALSEVRADKEREAGDGFDGTWVAHPDLVPVAREEFERVLGDAPHQKERTREDVSVARDDLVDIRVPDGRITEQGLSNNVSVALQYLAAWLRGFGAAAINNLMEDTATAEISRAQLWQWLRHGASLDDGRDVTAELYRATRTRELRELRKQVEDGAPFSYEESRLEDAARLLDSLVLDEDFVPFLTQPAVRMLE